MNLTIGVLNKLKIIRSAFNPRLFSKKCRTFNNKNCERKRSANINPKTKSQNVTYLIFN